MNTLPIEFIQNKSTDELIQLYKQGYSLDTESKNLKSPSNYTIQKAAIDTSASGLALLLVTTVVMAFVYYNLGKWETKKLKMENLV